MACNSPVATVVGGGIAGCAAALTLARTGHRVALVNRNAGAASVRPVSIPARLLPLLAEFGIAPGDLGPARLVRHAAIAWETASPQRIAIAAKLHLDQARLDAALRVVVARYPGIAPSSDGLKVSSTPGRLIDATGRRSAFAGEVHEPEPRWVTRFWQVHAADSADAFALAVLPVGYALRIADGVSTTFALTAPAGTALSFAEYSELLVDSGAGWMLDGVAGPLGAAHGGVSSLAWTTRWKHDAEPVGDALLAGDTLSSQGIAWALSEAMHLHRPLAERLARAEARRRSHCQRLYHLATAHRFAAEPAWRGYAAFLADAQAGLVEAQLVGA